VSPTAETSISFFARNIEDLLLQRNLSHAKACFLRQDSRDKILWILRHSVSGIPVIDFF